MMRDAAIDGDGEATEFNQMLDRCGFNPLPFLLPGTGAPMYA